MIDKSVDYRRRRLLGAAGGSMLTSLFGGAMASESDTDQSQTIPAIRWGIIGTGLIANAVAPMIRLARYSELAAVSSRRMESARAFATKHGMQKSFDSWGELAAWDGIDAIYVGTPTSAKEEICVTAANNGKHILGAKPFASLASLQAITSACRTNDVGFMDGTSFVHHPRSSEIKMNMQRRIGWPWSVDSAFQFQLSDRDNIRFNPELEPMGAIGDAGWYSMRAAEEYLSPDIEPQSVGAYLRRDSQTNAAIGGSGIIRFDDGSVTTWNCGFDSGAVVMDLRISGAIGIISLDDFLVNDDDASASYIHRSGGLGSNGLSETIKVTSLKPGSALMFERFAEMLVDRDRKEQCIRSSERTQNWLDAMWKSAIQNERRK